MRIRIQVAIVIFLCVLIASVPARAQERSLGAIGVGDEDCIRITEIIPGSPAEAAGLVVGDILTTIDGEPTRRITGKFELTTSKNLAQDFWSLTYGKASKGLPCSLCAHGRKLLHRHQ
jgi:hypothetical protein